MRIVIIEDEQLAAQDLSNCIISSRPNYEIIKVLGSIAESIEYLNSEPDIDLIFSDIQLSDGLCFEIYEQVNLHCPIIFCTAFNSFTLEAFKTNGIEYLLKPFEYEAVEKAISKFENLINYQSIKMQDIIKHIHASKEKSKSIIVYHKDRIIPLNISEIAIFFLKGSQLMLETFDNNTYTVNQSFDEIEKLCCTCFFRANRQTLINRDAIKDLTQYLNRKLIINLKIQFPEKIIVSRDKSKELLDWLL